MNIDYKITYISFGENHTALLLEGGYIIMIGENKCGQLGVGNTIEYKLQKPILVKAISDRFIMVIRNIFSYMA